MHGFTVGDHFNGREHVEAADREHDEREEDRRADAGERDVPELFPAGAAVHVRRLVKLGRDGLERGEKHHKVPAHALPDAEQHGDRQPAPAGVQPRDIVLRKMQHVAEEIVEHALGIEDVPENQRHNDP